MSVTDKIGSVPAHIPPELVRHFDLLSDPEILADPYRSVDRMRDEGPILYSSALGGFWMILGAAEVREAFQRADVFATYPSGVPPMIGFWPRKLIPPEYDGEEHRQYRKLLIPRFSPTAVKPMLPDIAARAEQLIGAFAGDAGVEFIEAYARPLPSIVFLELFGLPADRFETLTDWVYQLLHAPDFETGRAVGRQISDYLVDLIEDRRHTPADDLISMLLASRIEGEPLSDEEVLDTCFFLFLAGLDTVTNQLGVIVHHLARHPEHQRHLRENPDTIPMAVEELLRAYPIVNNARTLTQDYELGGVAMKAGDTVQLYASGASRDTSVHPDGAEVDFDRGPGGSIAFGIGPHRCIGIHLARHELAITLKLMSTMLPPFTLAPDASLEWHTSGQIWGLEQLPLMFDAHGSALERTQP